MVDIRYEEWRDGNKYSNYPFSDTSTFKTLAGDLVLRYAISDASVHIIGGVAPFYIKSVVSLSGTSAEIRIADSRITGALGYVVTGLVDLASTSNIVRLIDTNGRDSGILLLDADGANSIVSLTNEGDITFRASAMEFVSNVCVPLPDVGLRGFVLPDNTIVSGSVVFAGENGVVLEEDNGAIKINVVGDPYYARNCLTDQSIPVAPMCGLKTINGIPPDANGDFKLTTGSFNASDTALRILPVRGGIQIILLG